MFRERLADKLSGLQKSGLKLPLINGVAQPAVMHYNKIFWVPGERIPRIRPPTPNGDEPIIGPAFAYGKFSGALAGIWYRVNYPNPIRDATPVVVGTGRLGDIKQDVIEKVGDVQISNVPQPPDVEIPIITRPKDIGSGSIPKPSDVESKVITYHSKTLTEYIDEIFADLPPAWESIAFVYWGNIRNFLSQSVGRILFWAQEHIFNPRTNSVVDQLNFSIADLNQRRKDQADYIINEVNFRNNLSNERVNNQFDLIVGEINSKIVDINTKVNAQFSSIVSSLNTKINEVNSKINDQLINIEERVNGRLDDLYAMWGIPTNMALTPLHLRNVDNLGFEFQSYGETEGYYVAVGGA